MGEKCVEEDYQYYLRDVPGSSFEDFIDYLVREVEMDREFTLHNDWWHKGKENDQGVLGGWIRVPSRRTRPGRIDAEARPEGAGDIYPPDNRDRITITVENADSEIRSGVLSQESN